MSSESCRGKGRRVLVLISAVIFGFFFIGNLSAQDDRKLINHPAPPYPDTAKKMAITGVVKVQVVIAADGRIKDSKVIGGHPMLVASVQETLKDWKYAPASGETTTILEFRFHP
jgi:TonB family protein